MKKILNIGKGLFIFIAALLFVPHEIGAEEGSRKWAFETEGGIVSSPAIGSNRTIYVGSNDGNLYAINPNGSLRWKFPTKGAVHSHPAIGSDGTIYIGSWDHFLYAINPDGTLKWNFLTGGAINASPALGVDGTIYIGSRDKYLYALNPNGLLKWKFETKGELFATPAIGADGTIYVGCWDHYIYAIKGGRVETVISREAASNEKEEASLTSPGNLTEIKEIRIEVTPEGEEKVIFSLDHYNLPRFHVYNGDRPRLVCDFFDACLGPDLGHRIRVNGNLIRQIRMALHKGPRSWARVVVDLVLHQKVRTKQFYSEDENLYTIVVSPAVKVRMK